MADKDPATRLYLCGRTTIECQNQVACESALGGRPGRLLIAYLATRRRHPVSRPEVIEAIWGTSPPARAETTLNALVSRLRATLRRLGIAPPFGIATDVGAYQFAIVDVWVDVEAAKAALDLAEGTLRRLDTRTAWASANVAVAIAAQPFLTTEDAPWIVREREALQRIARRGSIALSIASTANGEFELGIQHATEAVDAEPFDELASQTLMRAHAAAGNRAEALRVYARCRTLFRENLGTDPSERTRTVFLGILRANR